MKKTSLALSFLGAAALGAPAMAIAQVNALEPSGTTPPAQVPSSGFPPGLPGQAGAEGSTTEASTVPKRAWTIEPRITLRQTFTDNVAPSSGVKRSDRITEISPGLRIDGNTARLKLHFDYSVRQAFYQENAGRKNAQNYLNAFGTLRAVDNWLYVDVSGVITQQELSPFDFQAPSDVTVNANRRETSSFRVSPYAKGRVGDIADYEVRYSRSTTQSNSGLGLDVDVSEWRGNLKGTTALAKLGWAVEASQRNIDFQRGRDNEEERLRGLLSYKVMPELKLSASAGQERNNFSSPGQETHNTYGYGLDWTPSERTYVSAFREKRFFGYGHTISAAHRTPLSVIRFADSRDISVLPSRLSTVGLGTVYDMLFAQMASTIPDATERGVYVENLLNQYGMSPDLVVTRDYLTTRATVQRRQELSYALQGVRDILTLAAVRTEREALGTTTGGTDIFTTSRIIRQRGVTINLSHRLTPLSTLQFQVSRQNTSGTGGGPSNELNLYQISFSTRLSARTIASVAIRRALFDSTATPYAEKALVAAITAQF